MATKTRVPSQINIHHRLNGLSGTGSSRLTSSRIFSADSKTIENEKPSPTDFDNFIPWLCLQWQLPYEVTVTRVVYDSPSPEKKVSSAKSLHSRSKIKFRDTCPSQTSTLDVRNSFSILAYYTSQGNLCEIAITKPLNTIHCKLINAISIIVPFHPYLMKLTIKYNGLTCMILHKIAELLPRSNITEICLDDTCLPEGTYFKLLDRTSQLKVLSLNRCKINDIICKEIATRIDFGHPGVQLAALSLASNVITDAGVWYLGDILRRNRNLRHLNLAGNNITDKGLKYLMAPLVKFPLTYEEIVEKKHRKLNFIRKRIELYNYYLDEAIRRKSVSIIENLEPVKKRKSSSPRINSKYVKSNVHNTSARRENDVSKLSVVEIAEQKLKENLGDFKDPFDDDNVLINNGYTYCIGNFTLCSLNLAYNNLQSYSVKMIQKVLSYQNKMSEPSLKTKLTRLVLDGNYFPMCCPQLVEIELLLKEAVTCGPRSIISPRKRISFGSKKIE